MNDSTEFGYKVRQVLNEGAETLDRKLADRLHEVRQTALNSQRAPVGGLRIAGMGQTIEFSFFAQARNLVAIMALTVGAVSTYYWNAFEQAREYEEIDSALLADELPPSAYLDRGFHAWLERASDSSSQ